MRDQSGRADPKRHRSTRAIQGHGSFGHPGSSLYTPVNNSKVGAIGLLIVDLLENRIPVSPPPIVPTLIEPINHSSPLGRKIGARHFSQPGLSATASDGREERLS